jgi:hypothetical protein
MGELALRCSPFEILNAWTRKVVSLAMGHHCRCKSNSSRERGNRVTLDHPHLDVIAVNARKLMLFGG